MNTKSFHCPLRHAAPADTSSAEIRTWMVIVLTAVMMVGEITAGTMFHSMALLADGWHMSTHVAAFLVTAVAYGLSRRFAKNELFSFGTGKMRVLGGFASAVLLALVALLMAVESLERLMAPQQIRFNEAILVAVIGLAVNLVSALLLKDHHHHGHSHGHSHGHDHDHGHSPDLNRRAAYVHVLADALTSVTAIFALIAGKFLGWSWMDPVMGIAGSVVVAVWSLGLLRETSVILLDQTPTSSDLPEEIRKEVAKAGDALTDLHVWQVSEGRFSAVLSVQSASGTTPEAYRKALSIHEELVHVTVEVNPA